MNIKLLLAADSDDCPRDEFEKCMNTLFEEKMRALSVTSEFVAARMQAGFSQRMKGRFAIPESTLGEYVDTIRHKWMRIALLKARQYVLHADKRRLWSTMQRLEPVDAQCASRRKAYVLCDFEKRAEKLAYWYSL